MITTDREKILKEKNEWYNYTPVNFEIVKILKNRELSFIAKKEESGIRKVRYFVAHNIAFLKKHFEAIRFDKSLINMYQSVAQLKDIPVFSYNFRTRSKEEKYQEFNKEYENHVIGYDLFLDFDGKENFEKCHKETKEMKKIFDEYKIPYWMMNSSSKGFHFHIPAEYMPNYPIKDLIETIAKIINNIKAIYDFESLDTSIADLKRLCKTPYSFVNDATICLPLTDTQLETFTPEIVRMENILKNVAIKNRGLLTRTHNLTDEQLKKNVLKFIEEFR
jgi:hypothetical protein